MPPSLKVRSGGLRPVLDSIYPSTSVEENFMSGIRRKSFSYELIRCYRRISRRDDGLLIDPLSLNWT